MSKKKVLLRVDHGVRGRVSYSWRAKTISVSWVYGVAGLADGELIDPGKAKFTQYIALDFVPTDVTSMGPNKLAVTGVNERDRTVIKIYEFGDFCLPAVLHGPGGAQHVPPLNVPVESIETVFSEALGGDFFSAMFWNRGAPDENELFLFLEGADELHEYNTDTKELELVADTVGSGDLLAPRELTWPFTVVDDAETTHGCNYWFDASMESGFPALVFRDVDCDGDLDSVELVDSEDWGAKGYGDASTFVAGFDSAR